MIFQYYDYDYDLVNDYLQNTYNNLFNKIAELKSFIIECYSLYEKQYKDVDKLLSNEHIKYYIKNLDINIIKKYIIRVKLKYFKYLN
jgi:hypothetical protein